MMLPRSKTSWLFLIPLIILSLIGCERSTSIPVIPTEAVTIIPPTLTPPPNAQTTLPLFFYIIENEIREQSGTETRTVATLPTSVGQGIATQLTQDHLYALNNDTLFSVNQASGEISTLHTFDSVAQGATLPLPPNENGLFYTRTFEDSRSTVGTRSEIGFYSFDTAQTLPITSTLSIPALLGQNADNTALYMVPFGGDPTFDRAIEIAMDTGGTIRELPIEGDANVLLSPSREVIVTTSRELDPNGTAPPIGMISLYDFATPEMSPRNIVLPHQPSHACEVVWQPTGQSLLLALCAGDLYDGSPDYQGLWHLDIASGSLQPVEVTTGDGLKTIMDNDGKCSCAKMERGYSYGTRIQAKRLHLT
jgi:hypothetical protein